MRGLSVVILSRAAEGGEAKDLHRAARMAAQLLMARAGRSLGAISSSTLLAEFCPITPPVGLSEERVQQCLTIEPDMVGDVGKDCGKSANSQRRMGGYGDVVLSTLIGREAYVAAALTGDPVAEPVKGAGEGQAIQVPRKPGAHASKTSSRT